MDPADQFFAADFLADDLFGERIELETDETPDPRAIRLSARRRVERIAKRQNLAELLDGPPAPGEAVHIVSASKFDFWTWVPTLIDWLGKADALYCSTWTLSRATVVELFELWDAGKIGRVTFLTGLYFKRRETAVYSRLLIGIRQRRGSYRAFRNHAKVLLIHNEAAGHWLTVEGSANLTSNPRLEQYVVTNDRRLWDFHRGWFDEMARTVPPEADIPAPDDRPRRTGFSQRRAGLGVLTVRRDTEARDDILAWKRAEPEDADATRRFAAGLADLIAAWQPTPPAGTVLTCPPQGASAPGHYFAASLARAVADLLGLPFAELLERTDDKIHHGPQPSLEQRPYRVAATAPAAIVVDDLLTSGHTMKLALAALRRAGVTAWGFGYSGV